jgi:hypothetical protein
LLRIIAMVMWLHRQIRIKRVEKWPKRAN